MSKFEKIKSFFSEKKSALSIAFQKMIKVISASVWVRAVSMSIWVTVGVIAIIALCARAPEFHGLWIRNKVGSRTYTIKAELNGGGGTGFAIKAKSGKTVIVTNDHVCSMGSLNNPLLVIDNDGKAVPRNIIYKSDKTDLCVIEGLDDVSGLSLGSEPSIGQVVAAVGHPSLRPLTLSRGEIIGTETVYIPMGVIGEASEESSLIGPIVTRQQCSLPKNKIVSVDMIVVHVEVCLSFVKDAYITNALIQPGSSGSPVVNFWGNVVGVMFAGDSYGWGSVVPFKDLRELLNDF